jgi:hypothetical protein
MQARFLRFDEGTIDHDVLHTALGTRDPDCALHIDATQPHLERIRQTFQLNLHHARPSKNAHTEHLKRIHTADQKCAAIRFFRRLDIWR